MKKDIIKFILLTLVIYNIIPIINKIVPKYKLYFFEWFMDCLSVVLIDNISAIL